MRKNKRLGQHFLNSPHILEFEAKAAGISGKSALEIGGGDGRLTERLLSKNPKSLTVIEKDPRWAGVLRERFGTRIRLVEGDFLDSGEDADVIVGNIPYYISSPIIFSIAKKRASRALLMVQLEFAERMAAKPNSPEYGRLSVTSQLLFNVRLLKKVGKGAFSPPPEVDSAIILLEKKADSIDPWAEKVILALFQHKNQMASKALSHSGIKSEGLPRKRAREMGIGEILRLAESIRPLNSPRS